MLNKLALLYCTIGIFMAVTNNLTLIHACETTTDATTSCVMDGGAGGSYLGGVGEFVQGTYGYGFDVDIPYPCLYLPTTQVVDLCLVKLFFELLSL